MTQICPCPSTVMPPTWPMIQLLGNGFGQDASTAKVGTSLADAGWKAVSARSETAAATARDKVRTERATAWARMGWFSLLLLLVAARLFQRVGIDELEFLDALAFDLAGIDIAKLIDGHDMQHQKL